MLYPQVPAQHSGAKPALEAYYILGLYRLLDRYRRMARCQNLRGALSEAGKRAMHCDDQFDKLAGSELMMPHIAANDACGLMEIVPRRRGLLGHVCVP